MATIWANYPCSYRVSVKALIKEGEKLLLVQEGSDFWDLPGGGLEHNEGFSSGLSRELNEELGVSIAQAHEQPVHAYKTYDRANKRPVIALIYRVSLESRTFSLKPPMRGIRYFSADELTSLPLDPYIESLRTTLVMEAASSDSSRAKHSN